MQPAGMSHQVRLQGQLEGLQCRTADCCQRNLLMHLLTPTSAVHWVVPQHFNYILEEIEDDSSEGEEAE